MLSKPHTRLLHYSTIPVPYLDVLPIRLERALERPVG